MNRNTHMNTQAHSKCWSSGVHEGAGESRQRRDKYVTVGAEMNEVKSLSEDFQDF